MRTVLIGSDFMYDKDGNLKPIEINTAVGWDGIEKIEEDADCLDLTNLHTFINNNNFQTVHYIGNIIYFHRTLETYYSGSSITYEYHPVDKNAQTIPNLEDNDTTLIIRSAYDTTALVDDTYCRDKIEFMKLIESQSFGSQFAYKDDNNNIISNITTIPDNGIHPNFILKYRLPKYDVDVYPKFFKVTNQTELDEVISQNVTNDYFLMENYVNEEKVWNGHLKVIRSLNLLYPPTLESIQLGQYTKINHNLLQENVTYNTDTFELDSEFRESYLTNLHTRWQPKLLDNDLVEMADGTFKTALDLEIGDLIKTIDIPKTDSIAGTRLEYIYNNLTYEELISNTVYSTNEVTNKKRVNRLAILSQLTFEDGSTWEDTIGSSYLVDINGVIQFKRVENLVSGNVVLLLNTDNNNLEFVRKTIVSNTESKSVFSGWMISVADERLFLTKTTTSTNNESYVTIEHNSGGPCPAYACINDCYGLGFYSACPSCFAKTIGWCCYGYCFN
jgi:hypothetical protein